MFKTPSKSSTALHWACEIGKLEIVRHLISAGGTDLILKPDNMGLTCLHVASQGNFTRVVKQLNSAGGDALLFKPCKSGSTCLYWLPLS